MDSLESEDMVEQLKNSVNLLVERTGDNNAFAAGLVKKLTDLQRQLDGLTLADRSVFINQMRNSFRETIKLIEDKLQRHTYLENAYINSLVTALIFVIIAIFALFGYKLYKSLMEKELKKQEKLKLKQSKKAKKAN